MIREVASLYPARCRESLDILSLVVFAPLIVNVNRKLLLVDTDSFSTLARLTGHESNVTRVAVFDPQMADRQDYEGWQINTSAAVIRLDCLDIRPDRESAMTRFRGLGRHLLPISRYLPFMERLLAPQGR